METKYPGLDILTALESADRYNEYLAGLVIRSAGHDKELVDFGAGVGTFAKLLRDRGYRVACVEPDSGQRRTLIENGFTVHPSLEALGDDGAGNIFSLNVL